MSTIKGKYNDDNYRIIAEECDSIKIKGSNWRVSLYINDEYIASKPMLETKENADNILEQLNQNMISEHNKVEIWFLKSVISNKI